MCHDIGRLRHIKAKREGDGAYRRSDHRDHKVCDFKMKGVMKKSFNDHYVNNTTLLPATQPVSNVRSKPGRGSRERSSILSLSIIDRCSGDCLFPGLLAMSVLWPFSGFPSDLLTHTHPFESAVPAGGRVFRCPTQVSGYLVISSFPLFYLHGPPDSCT